MARSNIGRVVQNVALACTLPLGTGFILFGSHKWDEYNLHRKASEITKTNEERAKVYDNFGLEIQFPNLSTEQLREHISSHQQDDKRYSPNTKTK